MTATALMLLGVLAAPDPQFRLQASFYELRPTCTPDGSASWHPFGPEARRIVARRDHPGGQMGAEVRTRPGGGFEMLLPDGRWCIMEAGREKTCGLLIEVKGEGSSWGQTFSRTEGLLSGAEIRAGGL